MRKIHGNSRTAVLLMICLAPASWGQSPHPRDTEIHDADTRAWWHITEALSNDGMEGRDTGSVGHQRAASLVAAHFKAAGLKPAGDNGAYFQNVPVHEVSVVQEKTSFVLIRPNGETSLKFLYEIGIVATENLSPTMEAALTFRGYCGPETMNDIAGRFVVCFGSQRAGLPTGAERAANARKGNAIGVINIDDPYFTIEPPRWPVAYSRTVRLQTTTEAGEKAQTPLAVMRIGVDALEKLFAGTGQDAAAILQLGGAKKPLPNFDIPAKLRVHVAVAQRDFVSNNVLAVLPGVDPKRTNEYVVLSAHLDGYGFGTPVDGDKLYNGTLDDAAYVALLMRLADNIKDKKLRAPKRSLLLAAFTGEEKGLLGSNWFVEHPTVPIAQVVANINLDQLRPLFPLKILTAEALSDTSLGETARSVASSMQIEIRPDTEPERNLLRRADQYPFLTHHVPAISFIFGYDPNTDAEKRYREWYEVRYHRPQDDLAQPIDFDAAMKFNTFFYRLVDSVANSTARPEIYPTSQFAEKK